MTKNDIVDLIQDIDIYYPGKMNMRNPERTIHTWWEALKECDPVKVSGNLKKHVLHSNYIPTVAILGDGAIKKKAVEVYKRNLEEGEGLEI